MGGSYKINNYGSPVTGSATQAKNKGYALASIGYLLSDNGSIPASNSPYYKKAVEDVLTGIRHLRANAAKYHLDPDRFAITGFSAGGFFVWITCALSNSTKAHTLDITTLGYPGVPMDVLAGVSWSGVADMGVSGIRQSDLIQANMAPILIQHGKEDNVLPCCTGPENLANAINKAAPGRATLEIFETAGHGQGEELTGTANMERVFQFLDEHVKNQR